MKLKLLPWVSFHHDLHLMIFRPRGILDEAHIRQTIAMLDQLEKDVDKPFDRFSDLSKLDAVDLTFDFVFHISLHRRLVYGSFPSVKSAFLATSPATARITKTHIMLTDYSPLKVKMFRQIDAAAKWLGHSVEELEMGA
jgi:hypothetical protein